MPDRSVADQAFARRVHELDLDMQSKIQAERERYGPFVERLTDHSLLGLADVVSQEVRKRKAKIDASMTPEQHAAIARIRGARDAAETLRRPQVRKGPRRG